MTRLYDVAVALRSKNADPFTLTIDVILPSRECMEAAARVITREAVARLYRVDPGSVEVVVYPPALAVKINVPRLVPGGHPGDRDVYGAQQHAPLINLEVDCGPRG